VDAAPAPPERLKADSDARLVALGDVFENPLRGCLNNLKSNQEVGEKVKVEPSRCYLGLDAYQKVIDSGVDVVLLGTPPGFRPQHLKAAIAAGKHVFCEKPMATDARRASVMESAKLAKEKNLAIVAGFCWRYEPGRRSSSSGFTTAPWAMSSRCTRRISLPGKAHAACQRRPAGMGREWQLRNWYNFVWLSGDGLANRPATAWTSHVGHERRAAAALHGEWRRVVPTTKAISSITLTFSTSGPVAPAPRWLNARSAIVTGQLRLSGRHQRLRTIKGWAAPIIKGTETCATRREEGHVPVRARRAFASIRKGQPINDGLWMAQSSLASIMGEWRLYGTGDHLGTGSQLAVEACTRQPHLGHAAAVEPMAVPGKTKFV